MVAQRQTFRFSLKTVLATVTFVAMACAFVMQHFRLADTQASLSRYEASIIPTSLGLDQFRIISRIVVETDHVKVATYRIETEDEHFATVESGGDSNGCSSTYDSKTNLHFTEVTILFDHTKSKNSLKMMPKVGVLEGYTVANVPDDFLLNDAVTFNRDDRVYARNEVVELFQWGDRHYILTLKP